jgi:beta-galactosidase
MPIASLGVCYYPEHWPESQWPTQARQMREAGISLVRIGEFAWSRIEPRRGEFHWAWLDRALAALAAESLQIILCTPTACPPKWLVDEQPDILPVDADGRRRDFGSRRHYRFSSSAYRLESRAICSALMARYANHPAIVGWQTDNEYGCHETTLSYAPDDLQAFRIWLAEKYQSIEALNHAWGTVFWSQEYGDFCDVELANLTVTEANPAHRLDYWRFASDQVRSFNREQTDIIRNAVGETPWITHNFMGTFTDFDHFAVGEDLDLATWDSYPLGFLDQGWFPKEDKERYRCIGHPDWAGFHHDLYRAVGKGRLAVMEQQPGPVNWAGSNAMPLANAPAFWGMEAVAHGAEFVSFFRFQQLPRAQEQMHAALRLPNGAPSPAWAAVRALHEHLTLLPETDTAQAPVALLFDYVSCWAAQIQPHSPGMDSLRTAFEYYQAVRALGLDVDIVSPDTPLAGYELLIIPGSIFLEPALINAVGKAGVDCVIGCRSGSREADFSLPETLPPGAVQSLLPLRVMAVDSMRPGASRDFQHAGKTYRLERWYEDLDTPLAPHIRCADGAGFWYSQGNHHYLNAHAGPEFLQIVLAKALAARGIAPSPQQPGLRLRRRGSLVFAFNFDPAPQTFVLPGGQCLLGAERLAQGDYAVWQSAPA